MKEGATLAETYRIVERKLLNKTPKTAVELCKIGELLKRVGDHRAIEYFESAVRVDPGEPAFELFLGDYLSFFRGPWRPLFGDAETHYLNALDKIEARVRNKRSRPFDKITKSRVKRSLVNLYNREGLRFGGGDEYGNRDGGRRWSVSAATDNYYSRDTNSFDRFVDVRDFVSEALFAESPARFGRSLTKSELKGLARKKDIVHTGNRVRLRYGAWPVVDFTYNYDDIDDPLFGTAFRLGQFSVRSSETYGLTLSKTIGALPVGDLYLKGGYSQTDQKGAFQSASDASQTIDRFEFAGTLGRLLGTGKGSVGVSFLHESTSPGIDVKTRKVYGVNAGYVSRLFGPGRTSMNLSFWYHDIEPGVFSASTREQQTYSGGVSHLFGVSPKKIFGTEYLMQGIEPSLRVVVDRQGFGATDTTDSDIVAAVAVKRVHSADSTHPFDLTIGGAVYDTDVSTDRRQDHTEYRTSMELLYRLLDEQRSIEIGDEGNDIHTSFAHLRIQLRHDLSVDGPTDFESFRLGTRLAGKFFIAGNRTGPSVSASLGYAYQNFYNLDRGLHVFDVRFAVGF